MYRYLKHSTFKTGFSSRKVVLPHVFFISENGSTFHFVSQQKSWGDISDSALSLALPADPYMSAVNSVSTHKTESIHLFLWQPVS